MAPDFETNLQNKKQNAQRHLLKLHEQHTTDTQGLVYEFFQGVCLVSGSVVKKSRVARNFF